MSDETHSEENSAAGAMLTWAAFAGIFLIAFAVIAIANFAVSPKSGVDADWVARRQALLEENTAKGRQLIAEPGKNADGTFRIPVEQAMQVLLRDRASWALVETLARGNATPAPVPEKSSAGE